jgi:hypothetical protein
MVSGLVALIAAKGAAVGGAFLVIWIIFWLVVAAAFGYWGMKVLVRKGYDAWLGFVLGFFLTWIGIIICYVIPDKSKPAMSTGMAPTMGAATPPAPMGGGMAPPAPPAAPTPPAAAPTPPPPAGPTPPAPPRPQA